MGALASPFCEHKRLRTACATCRPPPPPKAEGEQRVKAKPAAPKATQDDADEDATPARPRGPRRQKAPTRAESEAAEAWWVKKK